MPDHDGGAVFYNEHSLIVFCGTLALMGLYGLYVSVRTYGWHGLLPWNTEFVTRGMEDEALACYTDDPKRKWSHEVEIMAGRSALRRYLEGLS